jgi:hypothetical protein
MKPVQRLAHGFPLYRESTFAEDYRSGKLSLVLIFRAVGIDDVVAVNSLNAVYYCAVISADLKNVRSLYLRDEKPMLVSSIQLMESIEVVSHYIPSLVRLYRIQELPAEADDGLLFFSGFDEIFKMFPGWVYGKFDSVLEFRRGVCASKLKPA